MFDLRLNCGRMFLAFVDLDERDISQNQATTCLTDICAAFFAEAPLVHPFRNPTNHAQRLRALRFAREKQSRLLWIVAYDKVVSKDKLSQKAQAREALEAWLTFDDRKTAGIPGFFPAVLDLPVRFTCEPTPGDRLKGVFTNARGWLRGWELTTEEE